MFHPPEPIRISGEFMKTAFVVLGLAWIFLPTAGAQNAPQQKILTNQDIIMLAKAGFSEDFIVGAIQSGKSHFDTSAAGLADLAKEGLNQRIVMAMAGTGAAPEAETRPSAPAAQPAAPPVAVYPEEMVIPGVEARTRAQVVQPSRAGLAIAAQTPYYESTSVFFGLFHKRVAVGAVPRQDQILSPQLGGGGGNSRMMATFPTLVSPAGSGVRYVVLP